VREKFIQNDQPLESRWSNVGGLRFHSLFAASRGAAKLPPVVLICGLGVSSSYMRGAALELSRHSDVYCPDLPGFGKSSKPRRALDISELSEALFAFLQKIRIENCVLVGHSFGCQIAAEFVLRHPQTPNRLVLAAPSGDPRINSAFVYLGKLALDAVREPASLTPLAVRDYLSAGLIRGFRTFQYAMRDRIEDKLPLIKTPTLIIRGANDPIVSPQWTAQVARLLPNAASATIKSAAHAVNYNSPKEFARLIREFAAPEN
jgi:2-hydroxy-6-oxonona-2,4-dienedioate hydrolase